MSERHFLCCVVLAEQDKYDVRENVASTETLLQTEHYQERAGTEAFIQVRVFQMNLSDDRKQGESCLKAFSPHPQVHENARRDHERTDGQAGAHGVGHGRTNLHQGGMLREAAP